jgi:hypothetical protein
MDLFKTEMLRTHPPQRRSYGPRRARSGCRSVPSRPITQPLATAVRLALAPLPQPPAVELPTGVPEAPAEAA